MTPLDDCMGRIDHGLPFVLECSGRKHDIAVPYQGAYYYGTVAPIPPLIILRHQQPHKLPES